MNTHKSIHDFTNSACPACGGTEVRTVWTEESFQYGEGANAASLHVNIPVRTCAACDFEYTDEAAEVIKNEAVCSFLQILAPKEIIAIREHYGMTQQEFADLTKIGRASLGRWERGALYQNSANDNLLYLLKFSENVSRLKRREVSAQREILAPPKGRFRSLSEDSLKIAYIESESFELYECPA